MGGGGGGGGGKAKAWQDATSVSLCADRDGEKYPDITTTRTQGSK